jgi:hypothetical protein
MVYPASEDDISEVLKMNEAFGGANGRKSKEVVESSTDCGK